MMRSSKSYWIAAGVLFVACASWGAELKAGAELKTREELAAVTVQKQRLPLERWFDGTVSAEHQATVSAETSGRVQDILADVGDTVPAGAVILKLVSTQQQQGVNQAQAALAEARANRDVQTREFQRVQEMFKRQLIAKAEFDRASGGYNAATARVTSAEAAVKAASENLSYTEVRAPYGGTVYERHVELGEAVQPGTPLMSGFDPAALRVEVDLPFVVADSVAVLKQAHVITDKGDAITPQKLLLFPQADHSTNTVRLRLELPPEARGLRPGQFIKVAVVVGEAERLMVSATSVFHRSEVTAVYVLGKTGPQLRQVRVGNTFGDKLEILAGLAEGEQVAVDPVAAGITAAGRIGDHE
jgi:RND family efflux transporter MFP subunit